MPGSAKGVLFITIEDETGVANLVLWPALFERQRRLVLTAGMLAVDGRVQREGEVVHVVVDRLHDLSAELAGVGELGAALQPTHDRGPAFPLPHGRGDEFHRGGSSLDARDKPPRGTAPRDIFSPQRPPGGAISVKTRDFR